jgi:hypothetical protein
MRAGIAFTVDAMGFIARPEVACVLRSITGCAGSMQKVGLLPLYQHASQVIGDVAYHLQCEQVPLEISASASDREGSRWRALPQRERSSIGHGASGRSPSPTTPI